MEITSEPATYKYNRIIQWILGSDATLITKVKSMCASYLIIILLGFMNINLSSAQAADEQFLAEAFFSELDENKDVYIDATRREVTFVNSYWNYKDFCNRCQLCDTSVIRQLEDYRVKEIYHKKRTDTKWNPQDSIFQQPQYARIKFVETEDEIKKLLFEKRVRVRVFGFPVFSDDRTFAAIMEGEFFQGRCWYTLISVFKRENDKWIKLGEYSANHVS